MNESVAAFLCALRGATFAEREMMVDQLRESICIFCGVEDPTCDCWLREDAEVTPS